MQVARNSLPFLVKARGNNKIHEGRKRLTWNRVTELQSQDKFAVVAISDCYDVDSQEDLKKRWYIYHKQDDSDPPTKGVRYAFVTSKGKLHALQFTRVPQC